MITKVWGRQIIKGSQQVSGAYLRRQAWTAPDATSATAVHAAITGSASAATTVTTAITNPDFARKISVTPGGTTADVAAGDVTITGTNIRGEAITDTVTFLANASSAGTTSKAFKTVTSIAIPQQDGAAATFSIGITDALGLDQCMSEASVIDTFIDGTRETTAATVTYHATDVSKNTVDPNTALDASKNVSVVFVATEITNKTGTSA